MSMTAFTVGQTRVILVNRFENQQKNEIRYELSFQLTSHLVYVTGFELTPYIQSFMDRLSNRGTNWRRFNTSYVEVDALLSLAEPLRTHGGILIAPLNLTWFLRTLKLVGVYIQTDTDGTSNRFENLLGTAFRYRFGPPENPLLRQRFYRLLKDVIGDAQQLAKDGNPNAVAAAIQRIEEHIKKMRT